ncbi:type IV secretion system protein [Bartonella sp. CB175]|uniref:type IV secretion system protein n=1 Tax=Bartonella sp. CB175 TaxID=3112256 RepID=UPI00300DE7EA
MKKLTITAIMSVVLATPSFGNSIIDDEHRYNNLNSPYGSSIQRTPSPRYGAAPQYQRTMQTSMRGQTGQQDSSRIFLDTLKKQSDEIKKQSEQLEKIYGAIAKDSETLKDLKEEEALFLKSLHLSYDKDKFLPANNGLKAQLEEFEKEFKSVEENRSKFENIRKSINDRSQHAAMVDKFISLKISEKIEDRSGKILGLLNMIGETKDLKGIAELQTQLKIQLAMSQNEATQLQMAAHLRNVEQAFISQQKHKRNMRILDSKNTKMPTIRSSQ